MRALPLIKEALLAPLSSALAALLLFVCFEEIRRPAGVKDATLGGLLPITTMKGPWWLIAAAVLVAVWFAASVMGRPRGALFGLLRWGLRAGFWWSILALLLFFGVVAYGAHTRSAGDLNWGFAAGYLFAVVSTLAVCAVGRARFC